MSHKLQPSTPKNHGLKTVALDTTLTTEPNQPEAHGHESNLVGHPAAAGNASWKTEEHQARRSA
jgi:hypothetical protein